MDAATPPVQTHYTAELVHRGRFYRAYHTPSVSGSIGYERRAVGGTWARAKRLPEAVRTQLDNQIAAMNAGRL